MLETIWFLLWGILWAVYFILDGYDLGLATMMPFLAKSEEDKLIIQHSMGPFWDGNEVWLITAGGVTFAAFPKAYAVMFSGLYTPLMLLLIALIIRGVSFEFRHLVQGAGAKKFWDWMLTICSFLPALLLGVAFANIFKGLPLDQNGVFQGNFFSLLNPYGLAGGIFFVFMFCLHGCLWLAIKSTGELQARAASMAQKLWPIVVILFVVFLVMTAMFTQLLTNYLTYPALLLLVVPPVGAIILLRTKIGARSWWSAWALNAVFIAFTALFGVVGMYPALLPSSLNPAYSITIQNGASSPLTLKIMLGVALCFVPIVIAYQTWMHMKFGHKVTAEDIAHEHY